MTEVNIFWFRRDLRLEDNTALHHALRSGLPVVPIFIFDRNILDELEDKDDRRVNFIYREITKLWKQLKEMGSHLEAYYGLPHEVFKQLLKKYKVTQVFANHDYEPYGIERDAAIQRLLKENNATLNTFKDIVILEKKEVLKDDGTPYTVFTPYSRKWKTQLTKQHFRPFETVKYFSSFHRGTATAMIKLEAMGFTKTATEYPSEEPEPGIIKHYREQRDFPGITGTSHLGIHLRFGTVSIRKWMAIAEKNSETFLNELVWREFYQSILYNFPHVGKGESFRRSYDLIPWKNNEEQFEKWRQGLTGYPVVDAGMRELKATGFMHNRVRMITASFLVKHLLIDWRWGEAWFARWLLDFEFASNNGGWQWASGSGCDAAPYFRIFNPYLQTKRFDPDLTYIRKWVPELDTFDYPKPIIDHETARKRCLEVFTKALRQ